MKCPACLSNLYEYELYYSHNNTYSCIISHISLLKLTNNYSYYVKGNAGAYHIYTKNNLTFFDMICDNGIRTILLYKIEKIKFEDSYNLLLKILDNIEFY